MQLNDYKTLSGLIPLDQIRGWSESDVALERRGVSLDWLATFLTDLQSENQVERAQAMEAAERVSNHNKAADYGLHDQPYLAIPRVPPPNLMNVHAFVQQFVKPLTANIHAPLYARIPAEHLGPPDMFISHAWNALLVGPDRQAIGTMDALAQPLVTSRPSYIWIDFVCYNQHLFETIAPDMERVIGQIGRIGFAATPVPLLHRSWCLWELLCSERVGIEAPSVYVRAGFRNDKILAVNAFFRSFAGVGNAKSSSARDQAEIFTAFEQQFGSIGVADTHIETLIREKLSNPWFELHQRDADLQFRPYPWVYDQGTDAAGRAVGIDQWQTFDPYYGPELRESALLGTSDSVYAMLIGAGLQVSKEDARTYELEHADDTVWKGFDAAQKCDVAELTRLLDAGLDVQVLLLGATMLHIAADSGHLDAVRLLLNRGAAIDTQNRDGWTALFWAAARGHVELARLLLSVGANVHAVAIKMQATPLHLAASDGHADMVALLLDAGADIDARASNGGTALHYAVQHGQADVVRLLLDRGADPHLPTNKPVTVVEMAQSAGLPADIVDRLR